MNILTYLPWINLAIFIIATCLFYSQAKETGNTIKHSIIYGTGCGTLTMVLAAFIELLLFVMYSCFPT